MAGRKGAMRLGVMLAALPLTLGNLCGRDCRPPLRLSALRICGFSWCAAKRSGRDLCPPPAPSLSGACRDLAAPELLRPGAVYRRARSGHAQAAGGLEQLGRLSGSCHALRVAEVCRPRRGAGRQQASSGGRGRVLLPERLPPVNIQQHAEDAAQQRCRVRRHRAANCHRRIICLRLL